LGDTADLFRFDDPDGESAKPCDVFWAVTSSDSASVFIVVPINDVMTTILNTPMATVDLENALWVGLLRGSTGDAISDFTRGLATLFVGEAPLDGERLSDMGEVEIVVEFGGGPDFSDFDPSMIRGRILDEIGFLAILEP